MKTETEKATPTNGWRPKHLSHSAIERWVRCPRSYYDSYVKRSPFAATKQMLIGTLFGRLIEDAHNGHPRVEGDAALLALQMHFKNLRSDEREKLDEEALDIVFRMFDLYRSREGGVYRGDAEYEFKVYLPDRARVPVPIKGFFDLRVTTEPLIVEAKTSRWATHPEWGWDQRRVDNSPQATLYHYAEKVLNKRECEIRFLAMGYSDRGVSMTELSTYPNDERLLAVQDDAAALWHDIESETFICHCGKCKMEAA